MPMPMPMMMMMLMLMVMVSSVRCWIFFLVFGDAFLQKTVSFNQAIQSIYQSLLKLQS